MRRDSVRGGAAVEPRGVLLQAQCSLHALEFSRRNTFCFARECGHEAVVQGAPHYRWWSPVGVFLMQVFLCGVNLFVVHRGCKTELAMRRPVHLVESHKMGTHL